MTPDASAPHDNDYRLDARLIAQKNAQLIEANTRLSIAMRELKRSRDDLIQSEKLAALGRLAAGAAHELNNPIMGVINYVQYCRERTDENDPRFTRLCKAERELERCARVVRGMLSYSRTGHDGPAPQRRRVICRQAVERALDLLAGDLRAAGLEVLVEAPDDLPAFWCDPDWMQQILVNLIANAKDAVDGCDHKRIIVHAAIDDDHMRVSVVDTGCGMTESVRRRMFDPFFTTKPTGQGSGLGMSVSQNLVKNLGGFIEVDSREGEGTAITVSLPIDLREDRAAA